MKGTIQKCNCGVGGLVKPSRTSRSEDRQTFNPRGLETTGEMDALPQGEDTGMPVGNGIGRGLTL